MNAPRIAFLGFSREHKEALQFFASTAGITVCPNTSPDLDYLCVGVVTNPDKLKDIKHHRTCVLNEDQFLTLKDQLADKLRDPPESSLVSALHPNRSQC